MTRAKNDPELPVLWGLKSIAFKRWPAASLVRAKNISQFSSVSISNPIRYLNMIHQGDLLLQKIDLNS